MSAGEKLLASGICLALRQTLKRAALRATEAQHQSGAYGNMVHDAETLRRAARILEREDRKPKGNGDLERETITPR